MEPQEFDVAPPLKWVQATGGVDLGDSYDEGVGFSKPIIPPKSNYQKRMEAMPSPITLLLMLYDDEKNATTTFVDTLDALYAQFPD